MTSPGEEQVEKEMMGAAELIGGCFVIAPEGITYPDRVNLTKLTHAIALHVARRVREAKALAWEEGMATAQVMRSGFHAPNPYEAKEAKP